MKETAVNPLGWLGAVLGAFVASVPALTWLLVVLMFIDTLFLLAVSVLNKDVSSWAMRKDATKKVGSLGIVAVCALIQPHISLFNIDLVMVSTLFYLGPELVSILRNAVLLGIPIPPELVGVMSYFQKKGDNEDRPTPQNPG